MLSVIRALPDHIIVPHILHVPVKSNLGAVVLVAPVFL